MRNKRSVDELSVEELERVLAIKRREQRIRNYRDTGRTTPEPSPKAVMPTAPSVIVESSPPVEDDAFEAVRFVDDLGRRQPSPLLDEKTPLRRYLNFGLLLVEIAAVVGLIYIFYRGFTGLENIQETSNKTQLELAAAREARRVTPTPAPLIAPGDLILPGGHTIQDGQISFNFDEVYAAFDQHQVPQSVRPALLRQMTSRPVAPREELSNDPDYISIPAIRVNQASISNGTDWETLQAGVGWFNNGARLGTRQNVVLVAHNDIYGEIFRNLEQLKPGDEVRIVATSGQQYTYQVTFSEIVEPDEIRVLDPNPSSGAHLTLITCHPYGIDSDRIVVIAELIN